MKLGDEIAGKYKILDKLGQGGAGTVYLAENTQIGNLWAVKEIVKNSLEKNPLDEAYMLGKLYHPALPKVFDIYELKDKTLIVMEYFQGDSLEKMIRENSIPDENDVLRWAVELCSVMLYLHNHKDGTIIYRDLKPGNIIILPDRSLRLIDFGIAREYKENLNTDTMYIGTQGFAAPEQYGLGQSDKRTDIYGFGVTFYCLLTGLLPNDRNFSPKSLSKCIKNSPHWVKIITKCISTDPNNRYRSFEEIIEEIREITQVRSSLESTTFNSLKERRIITIWDNAEFASEIAYIASMCLTGDVLVADLNLLDPQVDIHLGTKMYCSKNKLNVSLSGIDALMESLYKEQVTKESITNACIKTGKKNNLYVVTGNYNINNYEYFSNECIMKFLDKCLKYFDLVFINVNKSIYDSYTLICMIQSDINIYAGKTDIATLRSLNSQIAFLINKQKISREKFKVVSWCEPKEGLLNKALLDDLTENRLTGYISDNKKRNVLRNDKRCFVKVLGKNTAFEYVKILKRIGVLDKKFKTRSLKVGF